MHFHVWAKILVKRVGQNFSQKGVPYSREITVIFQNAILSDNYSEFDGTQSYIEKPEINLI